MFDQLCWSSLQLVEQFRKQRKKAQIEKIDIVSFGGSRLEHRCELQQLLNRHLKLFQTHSRPNSTPKLGRSNFVLSALWLEMKLELSYRLVCFDAEGGKSWLLSRIRRHAANVDVDVDADVDVEC